MQAWIGARQELALVLVFVIWVVLTVIGVLVTSRLNARDRSPLK
jgi:hypothetical protein